MFVSGLLKDQKIYPLPPWLKIVIPEKSFLLKPNMPYYFVIAGSTSQAPIVDQTIVIDETIDGQRFSQDLHITVLKPVRSR